MTGLRSRAASTLVVRRNLIAGTVAVVVLTSLALSIAAVLALHAPLSNLIFWPAIASFVVAGWLLAVRLPRNTVGWLLLMTAIGLSFLPWSVLSSWLLSHGVGAGRWTAGLSSASFVLDVGGLALLLPLLFPDGRLPSCRRWWRVVLWCDLGYMVLAGFNLFQPGPVDLPAYHHRLQNPFVLHWLTPALGPIIAACLPMLLIGFVGSFSSIVVRWRSADAVQRAQVKWVVVALTAAPVPFFLHDYVQSVSNALLTFILPLVPLAISVSVLRYRLYEIDRIISRAVGYLLVTGLLLGVYLGCIALTDVTLPIGSSFGVAGATLIAAALFQPLRRRVQAGVDRRFNRARYDAGRTIEAFAVRLRDEVDPEVVTRDLLDVAGRAIQPASISLWVAAS
jgi:hypothetical protein